MSLDFCRVLSAEHHALAQVIVFTYSTHSTLQALLQTMQPEYEHALVDKLCDDVSGSAVGNSVHPTTPSPSQIDPARPDVTLGPLSAVPSV